MGDRFLQNHDAGGSLLNGLLSRSDARDRLGALQRPPMPPPVQLDRDPPDPALLRDQPPRLWLRAGGLPWRREADGITYVAADPARFAQFARSLPAGMRPARILRADRETIRAAIARCCRASLSAAAERRVPALFSCRHLGGPGIGWRVGLIAVSAAVGSLAAFGPGTVLALVCLVALVMMSGITFLKLAGLIAEMTARGGADARQSRAHSLPVMSVLVPLYDEPAIVTTLLSRLKRIRYPRDRLDIVLVLEEDDARTHSALAGARLPPWIRMVNVPATGTLRTKPRALNYALDFCEGEIVGIWDAEDAPEPDQLMRVAERFATAPPDVACVQGVLDYYNARANWMARCFTIEYAGWFRVILPGLARMGLVIPLGGTTLFMRRGALEEMGGWDAHNVTEDADLGVRIARFGYRTVVISSTTFEEANCRPWPWVKQRSRWLKGFMTTYIVHMRAPVRLLRELGWLRFLGVQAFFAGTLSQFLFAPILWTYWAVLLGYGHPLGSLLPGWAMAGVTGLFLLSELVNLSLGVIAARRCGRVSLTPWVLTLPFYYPLGVIAAYKAAWELLRAPFYWDKTRHGVSPEDESRTSA